MDEAVAPNQKKASSFKKAFIEWYNEYGEFVGKGGSGGCYRNVAGAWKKVEEVLRRQSATSPLAATLLSSIQPPLSKDQISALSNLNDLPLEVRCSYRIHNGQSLANRCPALLGGYSFYDYQAECFLRPASQITVGADSKTTYYIIGASNCPRTLFVRECEDKQTTAAVYVFAKPITLDDFKIANSFSEYLYDIYHKLEQGYYQLTPAKNLLSLFPAPGHCPRAVTKDIIVEASPLFIPELSNMYESYFFAYQIRMWMPVIANSCNQTTSKLVSRHWFIEDVDEKVEEVSGAGVIGLFPVMSPGCKIFEYESCCPLQSKVGRMWGYFTMRCTKTGFEFNVKVPEFKFVAITGD